MSNPMQRILSSPLISRLRRNHALEHASIHVLSQRNPHKTFVGRSDANGFFLFGNVPTEEVSLAVDEAMRRLSAGEHRLALHPNCGTSFLTAGVMAAAGSFISLHGSKDESWHERLGRLPLAILLSMLGIILAQPLGIKLQQRVTTQPNLGSMKVLSIRPLSRGRTTTHRVVTAD